MSVDELFDRAKTATVSTLKPYLDMADTGHKPAGQFRVKWLRISLVVLWWLAAIFTGFSLFGGLAALFAANANYGGNSPFSPLLGYASSFALTSLIFDVWVVASLRLLARAWKLRAQGSQKKIKIWHLVAAIAIVCGRPDSFLAQAAFSVIPNSWWILWPIKFGIVPPVVLVVAGAINLFSLYLALTAFVLMIVLLPLKVFQAFFNISNTLFISKAQSSVFFGSLVSFWFWFTGMAFGHVNGTPLLLSNEKHVLIMASTRSGKGVSLIIPHLLRYRGSAFVLDPKGENARATGRRRAALNDKVHYLDPFGLSGKTKARFNPLARMTLDNMEAESKSLAAALILSPQRDHWTASAQQLLAAVILHVFTSPNIPKEKKDLPTVRHLLLSEMAQVLDEMLHSDVADGLLSDLGSSFAQTPEKERGSIISTAQRETEILDNPFIAACLSASGEGEEVDFAHWHTGTMTVYLCLSAPKFPIFNRWLRLVLTAALDEMTDTLNPPSVPICFMLDELATLGNLQAVENAIGLAAGYGIQLVTVFQDVAQMKDLYKGRWASFIGNAGVRALFNLDDYDTAQYWSRFIGGHLVETTSVSQSNEGLSKGQTKGETMRALKSPEELMLEFAQHNMLILPQGSHPIITKRVTYYHDDELKGLWDDPRTDKEKKAAPPAARVTPPSPPVQRQEIVRENPAQEMRRPAPPAPAEAMPPIEAEAARKEQGRVKEVLFETPTIYFPKTSSQSAREKQLETKPAPPVQPKTEPAKVAPAPVITATRTASVSTPVSPKPTPPIQPKAEAPKVTPAPVVAAPKSAPAPVVAAPSVETAREKERREHQEAKQRQAEREQAERAGRQKAAPSEDHEGAKERALRNEILKNLGFDGIEKFEEMLNRVKGRKS